MRILWGASTLESAHGPSSTWPDDFDIGAAFAIGYIDEEKTLPGERKRKGLDEIVFGGDWGRPAEIFGEQG